MSKALPRKNTIHLPRGFAFSSLAVGIKASGGLDLGLVECSPKTTAAAVFTTNRVAAAPVHVGRASLRSSRGRVRAVIVNSGNANCATGPSGLADCEQICRAVARALKVKSNQVFPSSTGIIGVPLSTDKIVPEIEALVAQRDTSIEAVHQFARSILTTDTRSKLASDLISLRGKTVKILGLAKGSGMIHPQLATMLVYLFTDIAAKPAQLQKLLRNTCDQTFNCISVDGDTSTNDTVLLLASGMSGVRLDNGKQEKSFRDALLRVCFSLAHQIVSDGEGVRHVVELTVEEARSREEARKVAKAISRSPLVKTAWTGADPNWGRILAAVGNSGVPIDPASVNIFIGNQRVCNRGSAHPFDEKEAHEHLSHAECNVRVQLGRGRHALRFYTTDLSAEYVRINADYST